MQIAINRRDRTLRVDDAACPYHPAIEAALAASVRAFDELWRLTIRDGEVISATLSTGRAAVGTVTDWPAIRAAVEPVAAAAAAAAHVASVKSACSGRIYAVMSDATQKNFAAYGAAIALTAATGTLSPAQSADAATLQAAREWVEAMLAASRHAIETGAAPVWPSLPDGVEALAARF